MSNLTVTVPGLGRVAMPSRRQLEQAAIGVAAVVALLLLAHSQGFSVPFPVVLLGVIIGLTYGLLAVGLVLIYRTNKIINFAHGQIGAFGAAFFGLIAVKYHVPYWIAFPMAMALAGGVGMVAEAGVVRRLRKAPRLMSIVATLGVGQFLAVFALVINSQAAAGWIFPQPSWLPVFNIGALRVTPAYSGMLILSPIVVLVLAGFLRYSRFGLFMRSAAANPEAARMAGINANRMSALAWAIAGGLSAISAILTAPTQGFTNSDSFGPALLLRAMTGAVIARMSSLPKALAAGVGLGVIEQLVLWNYPHSGLVEVSLFVIIWGALLLQKQRGGRDEEKGSWAAVQAWRPVPDALRKVWLIRNLGLVTGLISLGVVASLPLFINNSDSITIVGIMGFAIVGLSIGVITGLGGQLTLGQFAVAAVGAVASFYVSSKTGDFPLAIVYAGCVSAIVSVLIGLPSLRIRGLMLTVTTLSFALASRSWLLAQPWMLGLGVDPGRPIVFHHPLIKGKEYYYFALFLLVVALVIARNIRNSGFGRLLIAIRDNEDAARAFTIRPSVVKIQGYLLAGFIAGIGGAAYAHALSQLDVSTFPAQASISVVSMTVIGGVSILAGPILGAIYVLGIPAFLPLDSAGLAATQLGGLLLILYLPGGLAQLLQPIRSLIIRGIAGLRGIDVAAAYGDLDGSPAETDLTDKARASNGVVTAQRERPSVMHASLDRRPLRHGATILEARDLRKHFGGVKAVNGVSFEVLAGETLGLIGPNGAGKTTTFELLGGFTKLDSGSVVFDRRDVSRMGPESRGRLGLIRSFQDAALFPTMTVTEAVMLSFERVSPTLFFPAVAGWRRGERTKERQARELVAFMGLEQYRDKQIQELSTGTRRICEIACLVALQPTLLLLDEPSSGIAQRETEALGALLLDLKAQLDLTLVIIEHDIPLIMGISDRIVAMADGEVISCGTPESVKADPQVIEAYLGGSIAAIERSGTTDSRAAHRAPAAAAATPVRVSRKKVSK